MATLSSNTGDSALLSTGTVAATDSSINFATTSTLGPGTIDPLGPIQATTVGTSTTPITTTTSFQESAPSAITTSATSDTSTVPSLVSATSILVTQSSEPASSTSYPTTTYSSSSLFLAGPTPKPAQSTLPIYSTTRTSIFDTGSTAYAVPTSSYYTSSSSYYTPVTSNPYFSSLVAYTTSPDLYQTSAQSKSNTDFSSKNPPSVGFVLPLTATSASASSSSLATATPLSPNTQHRKGVSLSAGAKIGIGVSAGVVVVATLAIVFIIIGRRRRYRGTRQPPEHEPIVPYFDSPELDGTSSKHVPHNKSPPADRQELESHTSNYSAPTGTTLANDLYPVPGVAIRYEPRNRHTEQQGLQLAETSGGPMQQSPRPKGAAMHPMDPTELEDERRLQTTPYEMRSVPTPKPKSMSRRPIPFQPSPAPRTPHEFPFDAGFMSVERPLQIANPDLEPPSRSGTPHRQPMRTNSRASTYEEEVRRWNRSQLNLRRQESLRSTEGERRYEER